MGAQGMLLHNHLYEYKLEQEIKHLREKIKTLELKANAMDEVIKFLYPFDNTYAVEYANEVWSIIERLQDDIRDINSGGTDVLV